MDNRKGLILLGAFVLVFIGVGVTINTAGVFIEALSREKGFSTASVTLIFSIAALVNMAGAVVVGNLLNRFDHRPVMGISILLLGGGMMLYAACGEIWHFYLAALLTGSGTAGSHIIPATMFVTRWFGRRRGLAMGAVLAGNGIGGLLFNPFTQWLIESNPLGTAYGFRSAYLVEGGLVLAVLFPTALLMRLPKRGEQPVASESAAAPGAAGAAASPVSAAVSGGQASLWQALRTSHYWFIAVMMLGVSAVFMGINQHLYGYFTLSLSLPHGLSSRLVGIMMGMTVPGILAAGALTDRIGTRQGLMLFALGLVIALSFLPAVGAVAGAVVFVLFYGFFNVLQTVFPPLLVSGRFGDAHYPAVYGSLIVAQTLGAAFGPFVIGLVYDATGRYVPAIAGAAVLLAVSAGLGVIAARGRAVTRSQASVAKR